MCGVFARIVSSMRVAFSKKNCILSVRVLKACGSFVCVVSRGLIVLWLCFCCVSSRSVSGMCAFFLGFIVLCLCVLFSRINYIVFVWLLEGCQ